MTDRREVSTIKYLTKQIRVQCRTPHYTRSPESVYLSTCDRNRQQAPGGTGGGRGGGGHKVDVDHKLGTCNEVNYDHKVEISHKGDFDI